MNPISFPLLLHRVDPTRNMARFYTLSVEPTLFGGSSLTRNWGRIGTGGRCRIDLFDTFEDAATARARLLAAKLKRGYQPCRAPPSPAQGIVTPHGAKTAKDGFVEPGNPAE